MNETSIVCSTKFMNIEYYFNNSIQDIMMSTTALFDEPIFDIIVHNGVNYYVNKNEIYDKYYMYLGYIDANKNLIFESLSQKCARTLDNINAILAIK